MTGIATVAGTSTSSTAPTRSRARIPSTLQAVFLAANRGNNVNKPPPEKVASKTFFRNWFFQRKKGLWSTSGSSTDLDDSKDELTMETGDLKHPRTSKQRISLRDTQVRLFVGGSGGGTSIAGPGLQMVLTSRSFLTCRSLVPLCSPLPRD